MSLLFVCLFVCLFVALHCMDSRGLVECGPPVSDHVKKPKKKKQSVRSVVVDTFQVLFLSLSVSFIVFFFSMCVVLSDLVLCCLDVMFVFCVGFDV